MAKIINISSFKRDKEIIGFEKWRNEVNPSKEVRDTKDVNIKPIEKIDDSKLKQSLERINKLMRDLKDLSRQH